ncbi:MAG: UxaA family hydrolase [Candidatus Lokiarchaeota archaeon]|nr:UxaA family hydrolase [Candidatus Lokiarchaeota archaeon]
MPNQKKAYIIMNLVDNCATTLNDIQKDTEFEVDENVIAINQNIPLGHKFALKDINKDELIKKYGQSIGVATKDIKRGDWIHTHNLTSQYLKEVLKD